MPAVAHIWKRGCTYHSGDTNGSTYDSNGKVCDRLSHEDMVYVAAAAALWTGTSVLLVLGVIYLRRWWRTRSNKRAFTMPSDRPMSCVGTPLIGFGNRSIPTSPVPSSARTFPTRPPLSPLSTDPSAHRSNSTTSSSSGAHSPFSANSENFHFPILSADGHLLPPAPASTRRSWVDTSPTDASERPLPNPPPITTAIIAPVPHTPKRWTYVHAQERSPSPERNDDPVIGLYAGIEMRSDDSFELLRDGYDIESKGVRSSPTITRIERPVGMYEPQQARFHRTLSAEAEELTYEDALSGQEHTRR